LDATPLVSRPPPSGSHLTTNFDTLVELAFSSQGNGSCQAIRIKEEADFWGAEEDRSYILKLHGDYDTHNVLNTRDETTNLDPYHIAIATQMLTNAGLLTLGLAGNEESVQNLFQNLLFSQGGRGGRRGGPLTLGMYWGVYVGSERPATFDPDATAKAVKERIEKGAVNRKIVEIMARANREKITCAFFPLWGSGSFLYDLIREFSDLSLLKTSELYLDHQTRLRATFTKQGLTAEAIRDHLDNLQQQRKALAARAPTPTGSPEVVYSVSRRDAQVEVRILYGDITSRSMMGEKTVEELRRAVVSSDDTAISAGGGVALALLQKAGPPILLNEISKLSPIHHCDVAVTSGGRLPVQYILHAAALRIEKNGAYTVCAADVETTMRRVLELVASLRIQVVWVPLLAAGSASVKAIDSFNAMLHAVAAWSGQGLPTTICIVVFREAELGRDRIKACLAEKFPGGPLGGAAPVV
jgi:O-acetyl-ADP-ribose deacetylase